MVFLVSKHVSLEDITVREFVPQDFHTILSGDSVGFCGVVSQGFRNPDVL